MNSCVDKTSVDDVKQLVISRPAPPSRLLVGRVSRDTVNWRSRSIDNYERYVRTPRQQQPGGLGLYGAPSSTHCRQNDYNAKQPDCYDHLSSTPRHTWYSHRASCGVVDDADRFRRAVKPSQTQFLVDYDGCRLTRPLTDSPAERGRSVEHPHHYHHHQQQQQQHEDSSSPDRKRLTLMSCVMADFSGLLRRVRRLRVRDDAQHETHV